MLIIAAKLSILDVCGGPGHTSEYSATWTKCNRKKVATCGECNRRRMQNENSPTCKSATWNNAQYIKWVQHGKKCNMRRLLQKTATRKWCSIKTVQHEKIQISTVKYERKRIMVGLLMDRDALVTLCLSSHFIYKRWH